MKKNDVIVLGIMAIAITCAVLYWWFGQTKPNASEITSASGKIKSVDSNIFGNSTTKKIDERKIYGNIPIKVESNYNRDDIFK